MRQKLTRQVRAAAGSAMRLRKRNRQFRAPTRGAAPTAVRKPVAAPGEVLRVSAAVSPEHDFEHGVERIDLDLEIAFEVADRIDKDLDDFLLIERRAALGERGPDGVSATVKKHPPFVRVPQRIYLGALLGAAPSMAPRSECAGTSATSLATWVGGQLTQARAARNASSEASRRRFA